MYIMYIYIYIYICIYIYIYTCIYNVCVHISLSLSLSLYLSIYLSLYIYIYIHIIHVYNVHIYIYIYVYMYICIYGHLGSSWPQNSHSRAKPAPYRRDSDSMQPARRTCRLAALLLSLLRRSAKERPESLQRIVDSYLPRRKSTQKTLRALLSFIGCLFQRCLPPRRSHCYDGCRDAIAAIPHRLWS